MAPAPENRPLVGKLDPEIDSHIHKAGRFEELFGDGKITIISVLDQFAYSLAPAPDKRWQSARSYALGRWNYETRGFQRPRRGSRYLRRPDDFDRIDDLVHRLACHWKALFRGNGSELKTGWTTLAEIDARLAELPSLSPPLSREPRRRPSALAA